MESYTIEQMMEMFPGTTRGSWSQLRFKGTGPEFFKVGRKVFYSHEAVREWIAANTYKMTGSAA